MHLSLGGSRQPTRPAPGTWSRPKQLPMPATHRRQTTLQLYKSSLIEKAWSGDPVPWEQPGDGLILSGGLAGQGSMYPSFNKREIEPLPLGSEATRSPPPSSLVGSRYFSGLPLALHAFQKNLIRPFLGT